MPVWAERQRRNLDPSAVAPPGRETVTWPLATVPTPAPSRQRSRGTSGASRTGLNRPPNQTQAAMALRSRRRLLRASPRPTRRIVWCLKRHAGEPPVPSGAERRRPRTPTAKAAPGAPSSRPLAASHRRTVFVGGPTHEASARPVRAERRRQDRILVAVALNAERAGRPPRSALPLSH